MEKWLLQLITHRYDKNTNNIVPITEDYKKDFCRLKQHSVIKAGDFYYDFFDNCVRVGTGLLDK